MEREEFNLIARQKLPEAEEHGYRDGGSVGFVLKECELFINGPLGEPFCSIGYPDNKMEFEMPKDKEEAKKIIKVFKIIAEL